jgi:type I restriction enzyme S subunit
VEWKTLGEVTSPTSNIRWRDSSDSYLYIDLTSVSRETNSIIEAVEITSSTAPSRAQKLVEKDDVIFATTRPTQLRICLVNERYSGAIASTGYCVLRARNSVVLPRWIYFHLSSSRFHRYVEENQSGSAYPAISDALVKKFALPLPHPNDPVKSLAEQARIVSILDKFDALTHSITDGLPREIELRQKQYEYYRDLLLSFPTPEQVEA